MPDFLEGLTKQDSADANADRQILLLQSSNKHQLLTLAAFCCCTQQ